MKYRLIQSVAGKMITSEGKIENMVPAFEVRGFDFVKFSPKRANDQRRPELIGQPVFSGLYGPMWDGDAIRYEDHESYARSSC